MQRYRLAINISAFYDDNLNPSSVFCIKDFQRDRSPVALLDLTQDREGMGENDRGENS